MKLKRVVISAAVFPLTLAIGLAFFAATSVSAEHSETQEPLEESTLPAVSPVQIVPVIPIPAFTPLVDATAESDEPKATAVEEVNWQGVYGFDKDSLPKAFRGLGYLEIQLSDYDKIDENGEPGAPIPPRGYLHVNREFKFTRIALAGRQISFQTRIIEGVSYRFTGKYLALDYCETDGPTPDISGELIKIVNGKWAASTKVELYAECGC